jgi:hypothetical protein
MHRHAKEAEMGMGSLANVTSLNDILASSPGDAFLPDVGSDTFDQNVTRMELQFTTLLADLLHRIAEMGHESYDSHMLTLLNRYLFLFILLPFSVFKFELLFFSPLGWISTIITQIRICYRPTSGLRTKQYPVNNSQLSFLTILYLISYSYQRVLN